MEEGTLFILYHTHVNTLCPLSTQLSERSPPTTGKYLAVSVHSIAQVITGMTKELSHTSGTCIHLQRLRIFLIKACTSHIISMILEPIAVSVSICFVAIILRSIHIVLGSSPDPLSASQLI
jgi:hypothetical protein